MVSFQVKIFVFLDIFATNIVNLVKVQMDWKSDKSAIAEGQRM